MIIFNLDGTLADCEHRMPFVDPEKNCQFKRRRDITLDEGINNKLIPKEYIHVNSTRQDCFNGIYEKFKPDWKSFYEACDKDKAIKPTIQVYSDFIVCDLDVVIWSGRCESVRDKTEKWLYNNVYKYSLEPDAEACRCNEALKMRPIGDDIPNYQLKERWLEEAMAKGITIEFVFDSDPNSIMMWKRHGIFVFNCAQN